MMDECQPTTRVPALERLPVVMFGMRCAFSRPPVQAMLTAGIDLRAVVVPGPAIGPPVLRQSTKRTIPLVGAEPTLDDLAHDAGVPLLAIRDPRYPDVIAAIADLAPAAIVVACFPWLLPRPLRNLPPLGALNVHPSLLPIGRGPEPIFWTFRRGDKQTGVTIHQLTGRFDAGPVVRQQTIPVPDGIRAPALEQQLAELGAILLVDSLADLVTGSCALPVRAQDERYATSAPFPAADDLTVATSRTAHWAFNFVRGVAPLGHPLTLFDEESGEQRPITDALDWQPNGILAKSVTVHADEILAQFQPGIVRFTRA